jgi:hypothetical protein
MGPRAGLDVVPKINNTFIVLAGNRTPIIVPTELPRFLLGYVSCILFKVWRCGSALLSCGAVIHLAVAVTTGFCSQVPSLSSPESIDLGLAIGSSDCCR